MSTDPGLAMDASVPAVAVVIPCHNAAVFLAGAIESVLAQSHPPATVIVVDDASSDGSAAVADSYAARGYPVRCLRLERNVGPATARNAGVARTDEPFVAFLDADDRWTTEHCESLLRLLLQYSDAELAFARTRSTDPQIPDSALPVPASRPVEVLEWLLDDSFIPQSAVLARRSGILRVGGYTDGLRYSEDYDLWLRMAHGRCFVASDAPSCVRTAHPAQVSRDDARMARGAWEARKRYSEFARRIGPVVPPERYEAICIRAYNRDLAEAWRSRSLSVLRSVLALASLVPGGERVRRRWLWRTVWLWPLWRFGALAWDTLPGSARRRLNSLRGRRRPRHILT